MTDDEFARRYVDGIDEYYGRMTTPEFTKRVRTMSEKVEADINHAMRLGARIHKVTLSFARRTGLTPISDEDLMLLANMVYAAWLKDDDDYDPEPDPEPEPATNLSLLFEHAF